MSLETHCKLPYIPSKSVHIVSATAMDTRVMGMQVKICAYLRNLARCARCSLRKKNGVLKMASTYFFLKLGFKCQLRETWMKVNKIVKLPGDFTTLVRLNKFIVGID